MVLAAGVQAGAGATLDELLTNTLLLDGNYKWSLLSNKQ